MPNLTPETTFDDYRLLELLDRGGMGEVWRARDLPAERDVAIKFVPQDIQNAESEMERVRSMFQQVHGLQHQHICPLYAMKTTPGFGTYIVMKFIPGITLGKYAMQLRRVKNRFPLSELTAILQPVAEALDYAHSRQVIHRDVKPGNILVVLDALERVTDVQLIDFGLAATFMASMSRVSQQKLNTSGTRPYMAPEQWTSAYQGPATDQYALAVTAYELLSGDFPFNMPDAEAMRLSVLHDPPQPIPGQPPHVNAALLRALAKDRKARFPSCADFIAALKDPAYSDIAPPVMESVSTPPERPEYATVVSHAAAEPPREAPPAFQKKVSPTPQKTADPVSDEKPWHRRETQRPSDVKQNKKMREAVDSLVKDQSRRRKFAKIYATVLGVGLFFVLIALFTARPSVVIHRGPGYTHPIYSSSESVMQNHGPFFTWEDKFSENAGEEDENIAREEKLAPGERMTKTVGGVEFAFRWCPPGKFLMGSPDDEQGRGSGEPQHEVTLTRGFWMLETEVTQQMYEGIMGSNPSRVQGPTLPVESVSWFDAHTFCQRLSNDWQVSVLLPTEAQWEYACRAGTTGPFAGVLKEMAWYGDNAAADAPKPVGKKTPNAWGLHDMHGNVEEWCRDLRERFSFEPATDPTGAADGDTRIIRGGSRGMSANACRSASRNWSPPDDSTNTLGFRIVLGNGTE